MHAGGRFEPRFPPFVSRYGFWEHEWGKHGTCASEDPLIDTQASWSVLVDGGVASKVVGVFFLGKAGCCLRLTHPVAAAFPQVEFFGAAINLFNTYNLTRILGEAGIVPRCVLANAVRECVFCCVLCVCVFCVFVYLVFVLLSLPTEADKLLRYGTPPPPIRTVLHFRSATVAYPTKAIAQAIEKATENTPFISCVNIDNGEAPGASNKNQTGADRGTPPSVIQVRRN